jgi:hypothetical protein
VTANEAEKSESAQTNYSDCKVSELASSEILYKLQIALKYILSLYHTLFRPCQSVEALPDVSPT